MRVESILQGEMLVCRNCFEVLGVEEVKALVSMAFQEKSYNASQFIAVDASDEENEIAPAATRSIDLSVPQEVLADPEAWVRFVGESLAPLLLAQYHRGQNQVNLLTACVDQGDRTYHFRAVVEIP